MLVVDCFDRDVSGGVKVWTDTDCVWVERRGRERAGLRYLLVLWYLPTVSLAVKLYECKVVYM